MARGPRQRNSDDNRGEAATAGPGKPEGRPAGPSWLEEAWHGWLKSVGGLLLLGLAVLAYSNDLLPEQGAGRVFLALVLGGTIYIGIEPALARFGDAQKRYMLVGAAAVWALVAIAPIFRTVFPGKVLAETVMQSNNGESANASVTIEGGDKGPYAVAVTGRLKGSAETQAGYDIEVTGAGESSDRLEGALERTYFNQRTSRRSAGTVARRTEHTEMSHRLTKVTGPDLKLSGTISGGELEDGLHVAFRAAGPNPFIYFLAGLLILIAGVVFDYRMLAPKVERTHVASAAGFTLAFTTYFAANATPHNLVKQGVAGLLPAALGALIGWGISAIACSYKPQPKKLAGAKNKFVEEDE